MISRAIVSAIVTIVVIAAMLVANRLFARSEQRDVTSAEKLRAVISGVVVGLINCFIPFFRPGTVLSWMAPVCLVAMTCFLVCLAYWWYQEGVSWKQLIAYVFVVIICYFTTKAAAWMTVAGIPQGFLWSLIIVLPEILTVGLVGYFVTNLLWYRYQERHTDARRIGTFIAGAITILCVVLVLIFRVNWQAAPSLDEMTRPIPTAAVEAEADNPETSDVVEAQEAVEDTEVTTIDEVAEEIMIPSIESTWYKFYHYETLKNESLLDDFDFGLSAWSEGVVAEQVMEEHFRRIEQDPALGAATFADFDVRLGLDFLNPGEHYDQNWSDGYWTTKINQCAVAYAADQNRYSMLVERWENFVRTYAQVKLVYVENVVDQMYMVTLTSQNEWEAPEVIIATTDQPSGHILSYVFLIKGNEFEVPFRSDCGFQPTNVAEVMKETPKANPVEEHYGPKPTEAPQPTSKPNPGGKDDSKPEMDDTYPETVTTPTPTPTPKKKKEPKEDPVNQGNAQKGGGDNRDDDPGEEQKTDPRDEHPTGSDNDNNHGHSNPKTVTPTTPPVVEEHKQEEKEGKIVTDENPVSYEPDSVTDRGPAEAGVSPTAADGDGEFVPLD